MLFNAHGYVIYIHNINTIVQERYFTTICHRSRDWKEVNHIFGRCTGSWQHAWALMDRQGLNLELITLDCHTHACGWWKVTVQFRLIRHPCDTVTRLTKFSFGHLAFEGVTRS